MFSVVKSHLVEEVVPVTVQVHLATVPGQRGWEMLESHERVWEPPVAIRSDNFVHVQEKRLFNDI